MTTTAVASVRQMQSQATVTVYGLPACRHTVETRLALDDNGLGYKFVDLTHNTTACEYVASFGCFQTPFVVAVVGSRPYSWSGNRPDLVTALVHRIAAHRTV